MFWPGFRRRYEQALSDALRKRHAQVHARLSAKLDEQRTLEVAAHETVQSSVARGMELLRAADEHSTARMRAEREASLVRAQQRFEELRPLLVRERRLELLAQAEKVLKERMAREGRGGV